MGHIGRTTLDIKPNIFGGAVFDGDVIGTSLSVMEVAEQNNHHANCVVPGYWNDPDMPVMII